VRVLITGGTGTVGEALVSELHAGGHDVLVYAASGAASDAVRVEVGDVLDVSRLRGVMQGFAPEVAIHAAALTPDVRAESAAPDRILEVNTIGALRVLTALADAGGGRFVQISSVAAYGDAVERADALREQIDDGRPRTLYELSKAAAESAVLRFGALREIEVTCLRLGDVFGPGEKPTPYRPTLSGPYQATALAAAGAAVRLPSAGRREWVHTADVAAGVRLVVEAQRSLDPVINLGSGFFWTLIEWCRLLQERWPDARFTVDPRDPNVTLATENPPLDRGRMRTLGFEPRWDLAAAFDDYLRSWEETHPPIR
jgi:nucleoside-diphosphate-sugar epimerase